KSKQRVADHGEVFTPAWMVEDMLDLVQHESERTDFSSQPAGQGTFLFHFWPASSPPCNFGIELVSDNPEECRENLAEVFTTFLGTSDNDEWARAARAALAANIVQGTR